jgi:hypothetical protein
MSKIADWAEGVVEKLSVSVPSERQNHRSGVVFPICLLSFAS